MPRRVDETSQPVSRPAGQHMPQSDNFDRSFVGSLRGTFERHAFDGDADADADGAGDGSLAAERARC